MRVRLFEARSELVIETRAIEWAHPIDPGMRTLAVGGRQTVRLRREGRGGV